MFPSQSFRISPLFRTRGIIGLPRRLIVSKKSSLPNGKDDEEDRRNSRDRRKNSRAFQPGQADVEEGRDHQIRHYPVLSFRVPQDDPAHPQPALNAQPLSSRLPWKILRAERLASSS